MNKMIRTLIITAGVLLSTNVFSSSDNIVGKWTGNLPIDKNNDIVLNFNIEQKSGAYSVKISSPDNDAIKDLSAKNVSYKGGKLKFDLTDLNGSFEGSINDGTIDGQWKQLNEIIPLRLSSLALAAAPVKSGPSQEIVNEFLGSWHGVASMATTDFNSIMNFYLDDAGELGVKMEFPDQHSDFVPVKSFSIDGRDIKAELWADGQYFEGRLENGVLQGLWWFKKLPFQVKLAKKDWDPDYLSFEFEAQDKEALLGTWYADAPAQGEGSTLKFSFVETASGKVRGYINSIDDGWYGIRMKDLKITDEQKLVFGHDGQYGGKITFEGDFTKGEVKGFYEHNDLGFEIVLKKGEVPPAILAFPVNVQESLVGKWNGQVDGKLFALRFEDNSGNLVGFIDTMGQGRSAVRVRFGNFDKGELTLETAQAGTQLNATLMEGALVGKLQSEGKDYPVKLFKAL